MECKGYRYSSAEHLKGDIRTTALFEQGKSFIVYPMRVIYYVEDRKTDAAVKALFSVPKRYRHHAVDRNLMKRRMREAYRLNKQILYSAIPEDNGKTLCVAFRYVSDSNADYALVNEKMKKLLAKLGNQLFGEDGAKQ